MTSRTQILNALAQQLKSIPQVVVSRSYRFLEDINDFPTICFDKLPTETYSHFGDKRRLQTMQQQLRGYVLTTEEDSLSDSEELARRIEAIVNTFRPAELQVYDARVTRISTDEGLLTPYGICDVQVEISYEQTY